MNRELIIRLGFFITIFITLTLWEIMKPRREQLVSKKLRWMHNLAIALLDTVIIRLLLQVVPVSLALLAQHRGWGLLNKIDLPSSVEVVVAVIALDLTIYLQHVLFHFIPFLWPYHLVHHVDLDLDVTSGVRFHPIEIIISMGIKLTALTLLGAPPLAVLIFEILLNGTSMFNHSNISIPLTFDSIIRLLIVTPDMHRVHHSVMLKETNSNFGFTLSWWDRLFGTYQAQPLKGHQDMIIGTVRFLDKKEQTLIWLLALPFLKSARSSR